MYNLFIGYTGPNKNDNENNNVVFVEDSRFLEHTDAEVQTRYQVLNQSLVNEIKRFPALFLEEQYKDGAFIATITNITFSDERRKQYKITFKRISNFKIISSSDINEKQLELGFRPFECTRTHWAIKNADLHLIFSDNRRIQEPAHSWVEYKKWVNSIAKANKGYYYRGQSDPNWELKTSFLRYSEKTGIGIVDYLDRILKEVAKEYLLSNQKENINMKDRSEYIKFLLRLQHHGFPTPLLDWTLCPYVAAYFAFKDIDPNLTEGNVLINIFNIDLWLIIHPQTLNFRASDWFAAPITPITDSNKNPRAINQKSVTTATNVPDLKRHLIEHGKKTENIFLREVLLPVKERGLVMNDLNSMNIHSEAMFPDFDGFCLSMKEKYFNRKFGSINQSI